MKISRQRDGRLNIEFGHGVNVKGLAAREEKTSFFGKLLPKVYTRLYNAFAKMTGIERRAIRDKTHIYTVETSAFHEVINGKMIFQNRSRLIERLSDMDKLNDEVDNKYGGKVARFLNSEEIKDTFKVLLRDKSRTAEYALTNVVDKLGRYSFHHYAQRGDIGSLMNNYVKMEKIYRSKENDTEQNENILTTIGFCRSLKNFTKGYQELNKRPLSTDKYFIEMMKPRGPYPFIGYYIYRDYHELNECYVVYQNKKKKNDQEIS